ncbi:DUF4167 domain-containing protein [Roseospira navarrensis]|uniref:DUF4167 domain-containing protein n=1 Tax=Roseospira navarrensis TaxID=140058 RepID=UPI001478ECBA
MKQGSNTRGRPRGRVGGGSGGKRTPNRNQTFDSNGPGIRLRGNAMQLVEKYTGLARDAGSQGDRVLSENYLQHADHYYRVYMALTGQADAARPGQGGGARPSNANGGADDIGGFEGSGSRRDGDGTGDAEGDDDFAADAPRRGNGRDQVGRDRGRRGNGTSRGGASSDEARTMSAGNDGEPGGDGDTDAQDGADESARSDEGQAPRRRTSRRSVRSSTRSAGRDDGTAEDSGSGDEDASATAGEDAAPPRRSRRNPRRTASSGGKGADGERAAEASDGPAADGSSA